MLQLILAETIPTICFCFINSTLNSLQNFCFFQLQKINTRSFSFAAEVMGVFKENSVGFNKMLQNLSIICFTHHFYTYHLPCITIASSNTFQQTLESYSLKNRKNLFPSISFHECSKCQQKIVLVTHFKSRQRVAWKFISV